MLGRQPSGLPTHTCVSNNVIDSLLKTAGARNAGMNESLRKRALSDWPCAAVAFMRQIDDDVLLAANAAGNDVRVGTSTIPGAGKGVFALRDFDVDETTMPFWGTLVYKDLSAAAVSNVPELKNFTYGSGLGTTTAIRWLKTAAEDVTSPDFWAQTA